MNKACGAVWDGVHREQAERLTMPLFLFSTAVTSTTTAVLILMLPFETPAIILAITNRGKL